MSEADSEAKKREDSRARSDDARAAPPDKEQRRPRPGGKEAKNGQEDSGGGEREKERGRTNNLHGSRVTGEMGGRRLAGARALSGVEWNRDGVELLEFASVAKGPTRLCSSGGWAAVTCFLRRWSRCPAPLWFGIQS